MGFFAETSSTDADTILQAGFGNLFGDAGERAKDLSGDLLGIGEARLADKLDPFQIPTSTPGFNFNSFLSSSKFGQPLYNELINPQFAPQTSSEQSLINELISQMQGQTAVRGLDPTFASIAETIAPQLIGLRQQRLGNLQGAFGGELEGVLGGRGQDIGERGADIAAGLTGRGQDIDFRSDQVAQAANILTSVLGLDRMDTVVGGGASEAEGNVSAGIMKAAATVAMIYASDRRLKENIIKVGQLANGLFVYSFNYLWDKSPVIGVMADEVRKVLPHAVYVHSSGYDMVDYGEVLT